MWSSAECNMGTDYTGSFIKTATHSHVYNKVTFRLKFTWYLSAVVMKTVEAFVRNHILYNIPNSRYTQQNGRLTVYFATNMLVWPFELPSVLSCQPSFQPTRLHRSRQYTCASHTITCEGCRIAAILEYSKGRMVSRQNGAVFSVFQKISCKMSALGLLQRSWCKYKSSGTSHCAVGYKLTEISERPWR